MDYKIVVSTGASVGLGRAIAIEFAKKKINVGLISRNHERMEPIH